MTAFLYKMTCLTNLHVGNGDVNYSIIDNEVELDYVLKEPTIPSSGVKGALLSYIESLPENKFANKEELIKTVFGKEDNAKGTYKFLSANLLSRPVRVSEGNYSYANATSYELIERYNNLCESFNIETEKIEAVSHGCFASDGITEIEGKEISQETDSISTLIPSPFAVMPNAVLNEIPLPVGARNRLGENKNLWYEQYVPYYSIFYMIIILPDEKNLLNKYIHEKNVQFGGNASIGQGLIKIELLAQSK